MKIFTLSRKPPIPRKVKAGTMLDLGGGKLFPNKNTPEGAITVNRHPETDPDFLGDARNLPFEEERFRQVKASLLPQALLHGENLRRIAREAHRVLKPGGRFRLDVEVFPERLEEETRAEVDLAEVNAKEIRRWSIQIHWLKEAPPSCRMCCTEEEMREALEEAGFEKLYVWQEEPKPWPSIRKATFIAVKPKMTEQA